MKTQKAPSLFKGRWHTQCDGRVSPGWQDHSLPNPMDDEKSEEKNMELSIVNCGLSVVSCELWVKKSGKRKVESG